MNNTPTEQYNVIFLLDRQPPSRVVLLQRAPDKKLMPIFGRESVVKSKPMKPL